MSEKSITTSKLIVVQSNESSDDEKVSKNDDLGLSLDKLNLGPQKKLLILCLGGLLVHRVHIRDKATVRGLRPDVAYGKFFVFKRPFCTEFLRFCFEKFEVGIWSSARDHNIDAVLSNITSGIRNKLLFVWGQEDCIDSGFYCLDNSKKPLFLKQLKDVWNNRYYNKGGRFSAKSTLLIDDEPHVALLNPPNTSIFVPPYKRHDDKDTFLGPEGELRKYLEGVAEAEDVPSYVKDHPIGQPAITESHPDWSFYEKIVRHFGKTNERKGTGTSAT